MLTKNDAQHQDTLGVLGVQQAHCLADPVGAGLHSFGIVVVAGDDGPNVAVQPVIGQVGGDRRAGVVADDGDGPPGPVRGDDQVG
jgi:hypothetical protein